MKIIDKLKGYFKTEKGQKTIILIKSIIVGLFVAIFVALCCTVERKNNKIKYYKQTITEQTIIIDSLQKENKAIGSLSAITVNVQFTLTQKNILSLSQLNAHNIAKDISSMTKAELYDSLYRKQK